MTKPTPYFGDTECQHSDCPRFADVVINGRKLCQRHASEYFDQLHPTKKEVPA